MRLFIGIIICFAFIAACSSSETDSYEVGGDFLESDVVIRVLDTFTVNTGTFKIEDLVTSGSGRILLGHINDDRLGELTSKSFFQVSNINYNIDLEAEYDSIGFVMNYDSYYFGDTLQPQTYKFYKITETVEVEDTDVSFFNTSTLEYDATEVIGEVTFTPRPNRDSDSLYVPIDDVLGKEIFDGIQDNDINSSTDFLQVLRGITIIPDSTSVPSSHVLGFNTLTAENVSNNSSLRIYYSIPDGDGDNDDQLNYIDFTISDINKLFSSVYSNYDNSDFKDFSEELKDSENTISSSDTDDLMYVQGGSGLSAKVVMPSIKRLNLLSEFGTTLDAELTFNPSKTRYRDRDDLQDSLLVFIVDNQNRIQSQLTNIDGVSVFALLNEDIERFNTYNYSVDVTNFVETILNSEEDLDYGLMFQFSDSDDAVKNVAIEAGTRNDDRVKLSIKYLNY